MLALPLGYRRWASHVLSLTEVRWYGGDRCRGMATVFCEGHNGNPAGLYSGLHPLLLKGTDDLSIKGKERKIERKLGIPRRDLGSGSDCLFLSL